MPVKAFTMPMVVPSRPTNGAVEPTVARMPVPRLNSASTISIWRSTARSAELMSAAMMVARSRSSGFTSASASPSTRETWLFLFFSAREMAWSRFSSWIAREKSGANLRVSRWVRWIWMNFVIMTVSDQTDMNAITKTTPLANQPIEFQR